MEFFKHIPFNIRFTLILGLMGFILSVFTGLIFGINTESLFLRSVIFLIVFSVLGFLIVYVLEKYVPELYTVFSGKFSEIEDVDVIDSMDDSMEPSDIKSYNESEDFQGESTDDADPGAKEEVFEEMGKESFPDVDKTSPVGVDVKSGKLGKHIIEEEMSNYEPKLMAEAIRTMIGKDE